MSNISINGQSKVTGMAADRPLRERGRKSFLKEIGGKKLKDSLTLKKTMESLQKARQRYRQSMGILGKNMLLDIKLGRVIKRLEGVCGYECCAGERIPGLDGLSNDIQCFSQGCSHLHRPHRCRRPNF